MNYNINKIYKPHLLPMIFIFTMMFSFEINGINMRYVVLAFWFVFGLIWSRKIIANTETIYILLGVFILLVYVILISIIQGENNSFEYLRLLRCVFTYFIILLFLSKKSYNRDEIVSSLLFVLSIHAICTILSVIFPTFKDWILPISQYTKELLRYRSSGLLSGFDDAGMLSNFGMILDYIMRRNKGKSLGALTFLFAISAALASRFNMICMLLVLLCIVILESRNRKLLSKVIVFFISLIAVGFVGVFWIMTTNMSPNLRGMLYSQFPKLRLFYDAVLSSYTDYGVYTNVINRHWFPAEISVSERIFGAGIRINNSDIGLVKSMYSYGIIGISWVLLLYFYSLKIVKKYYKNIQKNYYYLYLICLGLMTIMETKTAIFLSSTSFEMITLLYLNFIINKNVQTEI